MKFQAKKNGTVFTPAADLVLSIIMDYIDLTASPTTPQYGFNKGLKFFEQDGYKATISELKYNLIRWGCVNMLEKRDILSEIRKKALAYLIFLKRKQSGKVKTCGCADG